MQEAFCRLLGADVGGLADEERRRYLFRIASRLMTDRWRRTTREASWIARLLPEPPASHGSSDEGIAHEFAMLTPRERALLWLAYVEGHNHLEIAGTLGVTRGSVKVLLSRARARLRKLLVEKGLTARAG